MHNPMRERVLVRARPTRPYSQTFETNWHRFDLKSLQMVVVGFEDSDILKGISIVETFVGRDRHRDDYFILNSRISNMSK